MARAISPQCAAQFNSLSDTLRDAAVALRRIVPVQASVVSMPLQPCAAWSPPALGATPGTEEPWASNVAEEATPGGDVTPSIPSMLLGSAISPGRGAAASIGCSPCPQPHANGTVAAITPDNPLAHRIQGLVTENASLREAFSEANRRLSRLEDEKLRFFDEGIYDLVNSVCGQTGSGRNPEDTVAAPGTRPRIRSCDAPLSMSPMSLSPASALAAQLRRSEEEKRSEELSGENEELRQELARASEVGEALEQQQQAAEDRMHALEQEQVWLAERFARLAEGSGTRMDVGATGVRADAVDVPTPSKDLSQALLEAAAAISNSDTVASTPAAAAAEQDRRRQQLEDMNRALRVELEDASRRQEELLSSTLDAARSASGEYAEAQSAAALEEAQSAALEECKAERAKLQERDRMISSLDVQTQALERRLRDTEAQARSLAEENSRLQAALSSLPDGGTALETAQGSVAEGATPKGSAPILSTPKSLADLDEAW